MYKAIANIRHIFLPCKFISRIGTKKPRTERVRGGAWWGWVINSDNPPQIDLQIVNLL